MEEQYKKTFKECVLHNIWFHVLSGIAVIMLIVSMILPPTGTIDPSVIAGVGEVFAFTALWSVVRAIDAGHSAQISHGSTTVVLKDMPENTENIPEE